MGYLYFFHQKKSCLLTKSSFGALINPEIEKLYAWGQKNLL